MALGTKRVYQEENQERILAFRRSIVAARDIAAGEIFDEKMLDYKRPGTGLAPGEIVNLIGKKSVEILNMIELSHLKITE